MISRRTVAVVFCLLGCVVARAGATPIAYAESSSGDLGSTLPAPAVFALDVGVNTVSGTSHYGPQFSTDFDSFAFSIPVGTRLTRIGYSFVRSSTALITAGETGFALDDGNALPSGSTYGNAGIDLFGPASVTPFGNPLALGPGVYGISNTGLSRTGGPLDGSWSADYTWSLQVDFTGNSVPEPTSLLLLATGLALIAAARKRKKQYL
jgi:hypothetical protein